MSVVHAVLDRRAGYRLFEAIVVMAVLAFTGFGLVGLGAALVGHARPAVVGPLGLLATLGLAALWRPDRSARPDLERTVPTVVLLLALGLTAASGLTNALHHGQYVKTDRDPGIYTAGGLWVAERGDLVVDGRGPGLDGAPGLETTALGQQTLGDDDSRLEIQGTHLFPTLLAEARWVGGDAGFGAMPSIIGMVGLLAFFLVALWFLPAWLALAVQLALALNFVFVYVVRSTLSEPTTLLFAFAGFWMLLVGTRERSVSRLLLAGVVTATTLCARIDGAVAILALPAAVAYASLRASRATSSGRAGSRGPSPWALTGAFVAGILVPAALARVDLHERSAFYLHFHQSQVRQIELGLVAGIVLAALVLAVGTAIDGGRLDRLGVLYVRHRRTVVRAAVAGVILLFVGAWLVRPLLGAVHGGLPDGGGRGTMEAIQTAEGFPPEGDRTYAEVSVERLAWYLGPIVVAAGVVGIAVAVRRGLTSARAGADVALLALVVPTTVLYLWKPSIFPDNPWMLRRYLPIAIPGLLLFAGIAVASASAFVAARADRDGAAVDRGLRWAARAGVVGAALVLVLSPLVVTVPLRTARWQAGGFQGLDALCDEVGPDAAVVFSYAGQTGITLLPSFRGRCGVPAARATAAQYDAREPLPLAEIQRSVRAAGRELWVVANSAEDLRVMAPGAGEPRAITIFDTTQVTATLNHPPSRFTPTRMVVWVAPVP